MIFKDEVSIEVKAGDGGAGAATFRREKYVPKGGPNGGDGGNGGDVIMKVNPHLRTLSHIHNNQKFKAENGGNGMSNKRFGKKGNPIIIEVPQGTVVYEKSSRRPLADLTSHDSFVIVAKGGKGGKGNVHFKRSTNQTPFYAQKGLPGEYKKIHLELKMIAHIGLVGFPNAGKSTLMSKITNAHPKIGNYPFTTLHPNIGVMTIDNAYTSLLIADIPGLIEGAHKGKGLGIDFLKHIERTLVILYILDATDEPLKKFKILQKELKSYSEKLYKRDFIIALNKIDLILEEKEKSALLKLFKTFTENIFQISALTSYGLDVLKKAIYKKYLDVEEKEKKEKKNDTLSVQREKNSHKTRCRQAWNKANY